MLKKARWITGSLIIALLICLCAPVFAVSPSPELVPDTYWAPAGETEIRFKVVSDGKDACPLESYTYMSYAPWKGNLIYAPVEAYREATAKQAEVTGMDEKKKEFTILFHKPGRYLVGGRTIYILDPKNKKLAAIAAELEDAIRKCRGKNEKETASQLRKWIVKKVRYGEEYSDYPEREQYEDLIGILTGKRAICTGYASLYRLMAKSCGIQVFSVSGTVRKNGSGHVISLNRLDGKWSYTDITWEDNGSSCRGKYFAMDEKTLKKYFEFPDYGDPEWVDICQYWFSSPEKTAELDRILDR